MKRLRDEDDFAINSYLHVDTTVLFDVAIELGIVEIIDRHIPANGKDQKPIRDDLTVGGIFLLGDIGRACLPTSKLGWYNWCRTTAP